MTDRSMRVGPSKPQDLPVSSLTKSEPSRLAETVPPIAGTLHGKAHPSTTS